MLTAPGGLLERSVPLPSAPDVGFAIMLLWDLSDSFNHLNIFIDG